jgi:putative redox protein
MASEVSAHARLAGERVFEVASGSGHTVVLDADPEVGGRDAGMRPMELLLASLAGCVGITVIGVLRKKRQQVTDYRLTVRGAEVDEHPQVFSAIAVEHLITGRAVVPEAVARAIELTETRYCPVSAMLSRSVAITHTFHIVEAGAGPS